MEEFNLVYNLLIFSFSFVAIGFALESDIRRNNREKLGWTFILIFIVVIAILFGMRDIEIGTDTELYFWQYKNYEGLELGTDFLMYYIFAGLNSFSKNPILFFFVIAFMYLSTFSLALLNYAKKIEASPFLIVFSLVSFFFFQSMGINIIRQGVSLGFFVLGLSYYLMDSKSLLRGKIIIPLILAVGFHFTALVPVIFLLLVIYFKKIKLWFYLLLYGISLVLSAFKVSVLIFKDFVNFTTFDERRSSYLDTSDFSEMYTIGFKPQFVLFNTIFLVIFLLIRKYVYSSKEYEYMLKYYLVSSALFFMVFQLPYSDRWGIMSWVIIPFMLSPIFRRTNKIKLATLTVLFLTFIFIFFQLILAK